jgi:acetyl-CoA carboxylase carboxyltransferase component
MMEIINRLVDNSEFEPYRRLWSNNHYGLCRIDGWAVGIVNQRKVVKGEMQFGGHLFR